LIFGVFAFLFFGPNYREDKRERQDAKGDESLVLLLPNCEDPMAEAAVTMREPGHDQGIESLRMTRIRENRIVIINHPVMQERERARDGDRRGSVR
jgi:hypothetical protein